MKNILIVDDEDVLRKVLVDRFEANDWDVTTAQDGEEAIKALDKGPYHVIILDLVMPKVDGFGVLEAINQKAELKEVPVMVLSNLGADADIKRAMNLGANDYFVKTQHPVGEIVKKAETLFAEGHTPKNNKAYSTEEEVRGSEK